MPWLQLPSEGAVPQAPHGGRDAVHQNREMDLEMILMSQRVFERKYSREKWMEEFGKNYP